MAGGEWHAVTKTELESTIVPNLSQPLPQLQPSRSLQATYPSFVSCFPQMKPENRAEGELTRTEGSSNKAIQMTDDEKVLMNLLKDNSPIDLNELKEHTGLSNKKWDKAIKGLTKNKLARVEKTDAGLVVSLV